MYVLYTLQTGMANMFITLQLQRVGVGQIWTASVNLCLCDCTINLLQPWLVPRSISYGLKMEQ